MSEQTSDFQLWIQKVEALVDARSGILNSIPDRAPLRELYNHGLDPHHASEVVCHLLELEMRRPEIKSETPT